MDPKSDTPVNGGSHFTTNGDGYMTLGGALYSQGSFPQSPEPDTKHSKKHDLGGKADMNGGSLGGIPVKLADGRPERSAAAASTPPAGLFLQQGERKRREHHTERNERKVGKVVHTERRQQQRGQQQRRQQQRGQPPRPANPFLNYARMLKAQNIRVKDGVPTNNPGGTHAAVRANEEARAAEATDHPAPPSHESSDRQQFKDFAHPEQKPTDGGDAYPQAGAMAEQPAMSGVAGNLPGMSR